MISPLDPGTHESANYLTLMRSLRMTMNIVKGSAMVFKIFGVHNEEWAFWKKRLKTHKRTGKKIKRATNFTYSLSQIREDGKNNQGTTELSIFHSFITLHSSVVSSHHPSMRPYYVAIKQSVHELSVNVKYPSFPCTIPSSPPHTHTP